MWLLSQSELESILEANDIIAYCKIYLDVSVMDRVKAGVSRQTFFQVAIHLSPDISVFSFDIVG